MSSTSSEIGSRRNLLENSLGIFVSRVLTTFVAFISIPIVVGKLGISGYGTWESIIAVSVLSNIFQGTISGTLLWMISSAYGSEDVESMRQYVRIGVCISLTLFFVITPIAWFSRYLLVDLFKVPSQFAQTAAWILPCIVGLMILGSINEVMGSLIGGFQRAGATTLTQAIAITANNIIVILCLLLGLGFWSLLIGFISGFIISAVGLYTIATQICGRFSLMPRLPTRAVLIKVAPYAGFMLLGALSMALRDQTDKIVLSSVASPAWTGYYGIAARLAGLVLVVCTFFYVPTIAASGAMYSKGDLLGIQKLYDDVITMMSFLVGLFVVIIGGMYDRIIVLWIGKPIPEVESILFLLLFGNTMAVMLTGTGSSVCKGMGIVRIETVYIIIGLSLNVILKFVLVPWIGAIGTVASSTISWTVSSVIFVILLHKQTNIQYSTTAKAVKTLCIILVCVMLSRWLSSIFPVETKRIYVLVSSLTLGLFVTLVFTLLMFFSQVLSLNGVRKIAQVISAKVIGGETKA
jgi:O-antigen/teichoic acid export membrane protein